jgi:hypothetical protein
MGRLDLIVSAKVFEVSRAAKDKRSCRSECREQAAQPNDEPAEDARPGGEWLQPVVKT